jgi:LysM repeat protein
MVRTSIAALLLIASINTMKSFKTFLMESPLPPDEKEIRDIQNYLYSKEAKGNEAMVLGLHGGPNDPTIGYGHSLKDVKKSKEKLKRLFPDKNADALISGQEKFSSHNELQKLFDDDFADEYKKLKGIIPDLDDYTPEARKGLMSSAYRGVLGGSPKAIDLFRAGEFDKGADELLNHSEYKASKEGRPIKGKLLPGIAPRMEEESNFIRGEAQRRAKRGSTTAQTPSPAPVGQEQPKQTNTTPSSNEYTIAPGDTFWKLGGGTPAGVKKLQDLNPGVDPNKIKPGQKIKRG